MKANSPSPFVLALLLVSPIASACKFTPRPTPPPAGEIYEVPPGAVSFESGDSRRELLSADVDLSAGLLKRMQRQVEESGGGVLTYRALMLSGGGSRGAYGAGLLTGWTELGTRPDFDVVTGVSTGALMATHAFLGSEFDDGLQIFRRVNTEDILTPRGTLAALTQDALFDSAPLRELLLEYLTDDVLDAVAREYAEGRQLFIGTTNLDANAFTVWDMGALANSKLPDRRDRYVDVILASASFPMAFPPVYIEVEGEDGPYYQMHVDGAIRENVFYFEFFDDVEEAAATFGDLPREVDLYLLFNGALYLTGEYEPREGKVASIGAAALNALLRKSTVSSIYRIWVTAMIYGARIHVAFVRPEFQFQTSPLEFDREEMRRLFELGRTSAMDGSAWFTQESPDTHEEMLRVLDPNVVLDSLEARPDYRENDPAPRKREGSGDS